MREFKYKTIISRMTMEEKAYMMSGKSTWATVDYEKYGIPAMYMSDGPNGIRKQEGASDHLGLNGSLPATCFPTAATIANSWDEALGEEVGQCLGEEAACQNVNVLLGPGLNIKRSPLCGRNFEYFSEDPYLAGKMAAGYVRGIQSQGIAACPKHFAVNSQELRRMSSDSVLDERTLREIYLTGFEIAVKEGKAKAIMSSYNRINGVYANENKHLLQEILVEEWGFDGYVVSDWGASNDHALGVKNGSHLEMPSTGKDGARLILKAIEQGELTEEILNERLDELLEVIFLTQEGTNKFKGKKVDLDAHHKVAMKASQESIILLKNEDQLLPVTKGTKVAVIGDFAKIPRYQGAGSSLVNPTKLDSLLDVMDESGLIMTGYAKGYERIDKENASLLQEAVALAKEAEVVLLCVGLDEISESEGLDRIHMRMPRNQIALIAEVAKVNHNVIAIMSAGSSVEMPWIDQVPAVIQGSLCGQAGAKAMMNIITGEACPSGKLNETYPMQYTDTPAYQYFPSRERSTQYRESLYVGYRYYDTAEVQVRFPFGFGLSYTSFAYSDISITKDGVSFVLTNTGKMDGAEIAQLYVGKDSDVVFRPKKELKGFTKLFLKAGESKEVKISFDDKTFRYFNVTTDRWEIEGGTYEIMIAANVSEIRLQGTIDVQGTDAKAPYTKIDLNDYFTGNVQDVPDHEFERLLGHTIPEGRWNQAGLLEMNDALCQMYYAKSGLARLVYQILTSIKNKSEAKGKPNLNILFIYNMPFRGLAKMTGGAISMDMAESILEMVNGHFIKGCGRLIRGAFRNRKL